jgi:hypothetical protein
MKTILKNIKEFLVSLKDKVNSLKCVIIFCVFFLCSCGSSNPEKAETPSSAETLLNAGDQGNSKISASAKAIIKANEINENAQSKKAINAEAGIIIASTGEPSKKDEQEALNRVDKYIKGKLDEAESLRKKAEADAADVRAERDRLREQYKKEVAEAKAQLELTRLKLEEERKDFVTIIFALVGGLLFVFGALVLAFSPFKKPGVYIVACGSLTGTLAFIWDSQWFKYTVAGCCVILLVYLAAIAYIKYKDYKNGQQQ